MATAPYRSNDTKTKCRAGPQLEVETDKRIIRTVVYAAGVTAAMAGLWLTSRYSYLLFHSLAELFSIGVAAAMFAVAWNSSRFSTNGYLTYVGVAYLSVAGLDLMHTLAFKGLGVFPAHGANLPTQLWIAARGMESVSLLIAPAFLTRRVRPWPTLLAYLAVTAALLAMIFPLDAFPTCYVEGGPHQGLTPFKIGAEYVICLLLLAGMGGLWAGRRRFSPKVLALITSAIGTSILSELAFTRYVTVYGDFNMIGHLLKVASFLLFYKATVEAALKDPYQVLFRDLKQHEQSLQTSEQRYRTLFENSLDAVILTDPTGKGTVLSANPSACRMFRRSEQEMIGLSRDDMFAPDEPELATLLGVRERTGRYTGEVTYKRADGTTFPGEVSTNAFTDSSGSLRSVAIVRDITERKQTEEALVRAKEEWERTFASVPDLIAILDNQHRVLRVNAAMAARLGAKAEECIGVRCYEVVHGLSEPPDFCPHSRTIKDGLQHIEEVREDRLGGDFVVSTTPLYDGQGQMIGTVHVAHDMTKRKQTEEALQESERRMQRAQEIAHLGSWELDVVNNQLSWSDEVYRIFGLKPQEFGATYDAFLEAVHPDDRAAVDAAYSGSLREGRDTYEIEHRVVRRSTGEIRIVHEKGEHVRDASGRIIRSVGMVHDITQRKKILEALQKAHSRLEQRVAERTAELTQAYKNLETEMVERAKIEEQLRQAHKMEAIGTLAGGIAHDFNNILASILGFTEMAVEDVSDRPDVEKNLQRVLKSTMRARDLVKQVLAFSRKAEHTRTPMALSPLIKETVQLLRASIPTTIDIVLNIAATSDTILASPVEMQQILMNLSSNASLAMQERGGTIGISLNDIDFQPESPMFEQGVAPGEYLQLVVRDTGIGMSSDVMKRVFEPFFTTRAVGKGTGMGLAVVYGIVKSLNGAITVESEPGIGSAFRIFLPKLKTEVKAEPVRAATSFGGHERILFVDDEDLLAELNSERLKSLGYEAVTTTSSREALALFKAEPERFDLVITDYTMPYLTGVDLAKEILTIRGGIPIILCTGHSDSVSPEIAKEKGIREFLMKPLSRQEMAAAIRRVLDSKTGT